MQDRDAQAYEKKIATLNRLMEVSAHLNSTLQLDALLDLIMETAAQITDSEGASVLLWNANTHELFFAATTASAPPELLGKPVPLAGSIAGTIMRERRPVEVDDTRADPRHFTRYDQEHDFQTRSLLGVPMTVKNRLIGVLEVINKHQLPWTEDDHQYLMTLAAQAAVAIDGAQTVAQLRRANEELSQLDRLKNDFIAIASHELRTPLGVILGYASFLQEETSDYPETSKHVSKVINSALRLRRIIEDLTNLHYLQQNAADLNLTSVSVESLIKDAWFDVLSLFEGKNQQLLTPPIDSSLYVYVDRGRIAMAMTNVLNNAMEFTPENGMIRLEADVRNGNEVWIRVVDQGIGIAPENLERIFDKFYQVENHMTRTHEGLGIGLSIARALVQSHGGRIWAQSAGLGQGTTITIVLPLSEAPST